MERLDIDCGEVESARPPPPCRSSNDLLPAEDAGTFLQRSRSMRDRMIGSVA